MGIEDGMDRDDVTINPPETPYTRGTNVRIPRTDGSIEGHWEVLGEPTPDGRVHVIEPNTHQTKMLTVETLDKYNGLMREGSIVKVKRRDGRIDDGWEVREFIGDGPEARVVVTKDLLTSEGPKKYKKTILVSDLEAVN